MSQMGKNEYWEQRSRERMKAATSAYNIKRQAFLRSLINHKTGNALKTDLWNEGGNKGIFDVDLFKGFRLVVGMDISQVACIRAKHEQPWMGIINADLKYLPFRQNVFDAIFDISTSDHLPFSAFGTCVEEYSRLLRENGELLLIFNNRLPGEPEKTNPYTYWFFLDDVEKTVEKFFTIQLLQPYGTHPNELKHYLLKGTRK